jgi:hypothetical protein
MTPFEDALSTLSVFQSIFNFYQQKFTDENSKIDFDLFGKKEDWKVSRFFPDLSTKSDTPFDIDSKDYFSCLTNRELNFEKYGLNTTQYGGIIYFESSNDIIDKVCKLMSVIARIDKVGALFHPSNVSLYKGKVSIDRKIIFTYGVSLIDISPFKEVHLVSKVQNNIKVEIKNENDSVPIKRNYKNIKCRGKWNNDVLPLFIGKLFNNTTVMFLAFTCGIFV